MLSHNACRDATYQVPNEAFRTPLRFRLFASGWAVAVAMVLSGCASLGSSGPEAGRIESGKTTKLDETQIAVVDLTDSVARRVISSRQRETFDQVFGDAPAGVRLIGAGDTLDISIWEAPPAALFGTVGGTMAISAAPILTPQTVQNSSLPPQMVAEDGAIRIPFVGDVHAEGLSAQQLEKVIVARLTGKAHLPQVIVRVTGNRSSIVNVVGDVRTNAPVSLTAKGERVLDALAAAGGVSQPTSKVTLRLTRGTRSVSEPLESILLDPAQNIRLRPGDVLTALFQPFAFTALGAVTANTEVPFEGTGLTLAQALGRVGGLQDNRANRRGVFIFRLEDPSVLEPAELEGRSLTPDGRLPVIYRLDFGDPGSFFVAQSFPIRNGDVLYVSNAPLADLQKFVSVVSSMAFSIIGISNAVK